MPVLFVSWAQPTRVNGSSSSGRLRNSGLCHFPLNVAEKCLVGLFFPICLRWHKTIMPHVERQVWSIQIGSQSS